jgi:hypothetical protein
MRSFVITSGGHWVPTLYREITLADFIPAVILPAKAGIGDRAWFSRWLVLIA